MNYSIYSVKQYEINQDEITAITSNLNKICEKLAKYDKGYHLKLEKGQNYILFGDIDHISDANVKDNIIYALSNFFNIESNDISLTESKKTDEISYHWSFNGYYTKLENLKQYMKQFIVKHPEFKDYIDISIYKNGWFRLPNQTNKDKKYKHIIINGVMNEFIVNYIPDNTEELKLETTEKPIVKNSDDNFIKTLKKDKTLIEFVDALLFNLDIERATDYNKWINVCNLIKSILDNDGNKLWHKFSQRNKSKYNKHDVEKKFESINFAQTGSAIYKLMKLSKNDNEENHKLILEEFIVNDIIEGVKSDADAAKMIYSKYKYFVCCNENLWVFDEHTGLWTTNKIIITEIFTKFSDSLHLLSEDKHGNIIKLDKSYGNTHRLIGEAVEFLKALCRDDNWEKDKETSSLHHILFKNGIYNMKTGSFTNGFNPNIVFFDRINKNYEPESIDVNYINDIKKRLFDNPLNGHNVSNYFLLQIARAIAGDNMKKIYFGLGATNGGKSTITKALTASFESYISEFNAETLAFNKNSADAAAQLRWALLLRYKRLILSNEIKMNNEDKIKLDGNTIKKVSSGGDKLTGRTHNKTETEFIPNFKVLCFANDLPKIEPFDQAVNNRLNIFGFYKSFVDAPTNEFELKMDYNIENEINTTKFQNHFIQLIFNTYLEYEKNKVEIVPDEVKNSKMDWIDEEQHNCISKFLTEFEITNDRNHFVKSSNIDEWLKKECGAISMKKFAMELSKYCKIKKFNNVESKDKKIAGKSCKVWVGIKVPEEDDEHDPLSI